MGNRKINKKAFSGRGIKINEFAEAIHPFLLDEFDRLRKAGIRIDNKLLEEIANSIAEKEFPLDRANKKK